MSVPTLLLCRLLPLAPALPPFLPHHRSHNELCQLWSQPRPCSALFLFEFGFIIQQSSSEKVFTLVCSAYMDDVNGLIQCPAVNCWKSFFFSSCLILIKMLWYSVTSSVYSSVLSSLKYVSNYSIYLLPLLFQCLLKWCSPLAKCQVNERVREEGMLY